MQHCVLEAPSGRMDKLFFVAVSASQSQALIFHADYTHRKGSKQDYMTIQFTRRAESALLEAFQKAPHNISEHNKSNHFIIDGYTFQQRLECEAHQTDKYCVRTATCRLTRRCIFVLGGLIARS